MHAFREVEQSVLDTYRGHHQFDWLQPRRTWLDAAKPVYIDFGKDWLARVERYGDTQLPCIRIVAKSEFLADVMRCADIYEVCL